MTPQRLWIILVLFGLLFAAGAGAQSRAFTDSDSYRCRVGFLDPDVSVRACTAIIQSPTETAEARNNMLYYRGAAYVRRGDYDLAIQDLDQALKLNPLDVAAWSWRGYAYDAKGDYDRAIQDFDEAIRLGKNDSSALNL